jgi:hypothetical protein
MKQWIGIPFYTVERKLLFRQVLEESKYPIGGRKDGTSHL